MVLDAVEKQLQFQPDIETKNRKPMRPNPLAPWELRIGNLRVYYDFENSPDRVVYIRAIGMKLPAASSGVSIQGFNIPIAASCGELDPNEIKIGKEVIRL
jgi:hypothetical protein